jgi:hypothetical protein
LAIRTKKSENIIIDNVSFNKSEKNNGISQNNMDNRTGELGYIGTSVADPDPVPFRPLDPEWENNPDPGFGTNIPDNFPRV